MTARRRRPIRVRRPRVEVRHGKHGRELRVEGTFASWYRPGSPVTGSVWDAIAAPILALPPQRRRRVLLLGVGGGSAARVVRAIEPEAHILGVELDAEVVQAARDHFDLDAMGLEVVIADALAFLKDDDGRYDLILEDVFAGVGRNVHKPLWLPRPGHELALDRLAEGGLLVSNTLDEAREVGQSMRDLFPGVLRIQVADYENQVFVGGPGTLSGAALRAALVADPVLSSSARQLSFRTLQRDR
ncbi:MAG: fused MFS/spermidine synthase [Deltaproteobacteria bacterium]|nr:fused MFS/spermidine synthase [Deltaproteobacteria bacterium]MBW2417520.1 fused MFS/spermidine synthase [Deltaproteobacteria bacterium]